MLRSLGSSCFLAIALTACATQSHKPVETPSRLPGDVVVKSITKAEQVIVVRPSPDHLAILCMAPFPDAVGVSGHDVTLSAGVVSREGIGSESFRGGEALGGRSADVLLARELLYRACELAANLQADRELTLKIYDRFLTTLESISRYQTGTGTAAGNTVPAATPSSDDDKGDDGKKD